MPCPSSKLADYWYQTTSCLTERRCQSAAHSTKIRTVTFCHLLSAILLTHGMQSRYLTPHHHPENGSTFKRFWSSRYAVCIQLFIERWGGDLTSMWGITNPHISGDWNHSCTNMGGNLTSYSIFTFVGASVLLSFVTGAKKLRNVLVVTCAYNAYMYTQALCANYTSE